MRKTVFIFVVCLFGFCFLLRDYGHPTIVSHVHPIDKSIPALPVYEPIKKALDPITGPQIKVPMPEPGSASTGKNSIIDMSILDGVNPLFYVIGVIVVVMAFILRSARSKR